LENIMTTFNIDSIDPGSPQNLPCSTAGGTWCYVTGTGLFLHNTVKGVSFGNLSLPESDYFVLSDQDMWFRAPATSAFVKTNGEHVQPGETDFDVEFEYTTAAGTELNKQSPFAFGYLPAVEAVTVPPVCPAAPPVLWVPSTAGEPPIQGMVTLNEKAPFGGVQPVMSSDNPEVSVKTQPMVQGPAVQGGTDGKTTATFPITVLPAAKAGSIVNISSGPGPGMDTFGGYASLAAVIGTPPIYLSLPVPLVSGQPATGVVYVQSAPPGLSATLSVATSNVVAPIQGHPPQACPGVFLFSFTPTVVSGRVGELTITVLCGAESVPFGPFTVTRPIVVPPPPLGRSPI
jgi:hypothetical protein